MKKKNDGMNEKTNRRDFLVSASRKLMLGGLAAMSGYLLFRESDENCDFVIGCGTCKKLSACRLPEAEDFRKSREQINSNGDGKSGQQ